MISTLKKIGLILLLSAGVAGLANWVHPQKIPWVQDWSHQVEAQAKEREISLIPLSVALERFDSAAAIFVDARSAEAYSAGHISGAVSIPFAKMDDYFEVIMALMDSEQELIVYCSNRQCDDALLLVSELKSMGCSKLLLYIDGFDAWAAAGGEVEP